MSFDLMHEQVLARIDAIHRDAQRPLETRDQIMSLTRQLMEVHGLMLRFMVVKTLDEMRHVA